jgi:hypothetical protein
MRHRLDEVGPPPGEIFRVGWYRDPLSPPPWTKAAVDGTFGNRFDDPSAAEGRPPEDRFRCLYCGTSAEAAFGESLAGFRVPINILAKLSLVEDEDESVEDVLAGALVDPEHPVRGLIPAEWRNRRRLARTTLAPSLRFANVATLESNQYFRSVLAQTASALGIDDVDFSTMLNRKYRRFTQACARHIYELLDEHGNPRFAGIRYLSRLNTHEWECWAIFSDRLDHDPGFADNIVPDHEDLLRIARHFDLTIEGLNGHYIRP